MSSNNISEDKKLLQNPTIFLGKKSEIIEKCKSCRKNINLIKCIKCSNYFCFDCIKNIFKLTLSGIKSEQFICPNCEKKCEDNNKLNNCFICKKLLNENNCTCFNVNKEQIIEFKNEINELNKDKTISLIEEENNTIENKNLSQKNIIKICHKCTTNYEYLIGKYFLLKKEKEENSKQNILDELTNIIMKEKGNENINIFDILENKSEKSEDSLNDNKLNIKKKTKDLFESMIVEKKEKTNFEIKKKEEINKDKNENNKSYQNVLINNNNNNIPKINQKEQNIPSININSNNKTSNIYLPNFFTITQLNNNQSPNNQNINQKISKSSVSKNLPNVPNFYNNINQINDIYLNNNIKPNNNIIKNTNDIQNQIPNLLLNNNNIFNNTKQNKSQILENNKNIMTLIKQNNLLNTNNANNKLNNCSQNLKDINEGINNLINTNDSNNNYNNIELKKNINASILNTLDKISKCLYNFDNNNMEINIDIINKIESLSNFYFNISQNKEQKEDKKNLDVQKEIKIDKEMNENIISLIDSIKNELKTLSIFTEIKKEFISIIYQNIDIYLKEMNKVDNNKNINQIQQQPNINNILPQIYPINSLNNLQALNLLNNNNIPNLDINALSNNLNNPLSQLLTNNNNISNYFPLLSIPISLPDVLTQAKINSLGNPLFQQ